jgi:RimJ/RimL family protein N-acetyltransferase
VGRLRPGDRARSPAWSDALKAASEVPAPVRAESFRPPVALEGRHVALLPLERSHREALQRAVGDPEVGRYLATPPGTTLEEMDRLLDLLLERQAAGTDLAFTIVRARDRGPIGMTRFLHIDRENESVEIGGTWLERPAWRTPANTEAKLLLFRHAFEVEGAFRVSLQTDLRNERSRRAIARLGATLEGVSRGDRLTPTGYRRSSVVYSVLADEWPRVRARLEGFLERGPRTSGAQDLGARD